MKTKLLGLLGFLIIKGVTRSFVMLNTMMEIENKSFTNILIPFLRSCSQNTVERNQCICKTLVCNFHHSIQHDEASGCTFYNEADCPN